MTFEVENKISDKDFADCFDAAVRHLQTMLGKCAEDAPDGSTKGVPHTWIKDMPTAPLLEHMSFMLGNQAFFVRLEDVESFDLPLLSDEKRSPEWSAALGSSRFPGTVQGVMRVASGYEGRACIMPMRRQSGGDSAASWRPALPGWSLLELRGLKPIDPPTLVNDERVKATDWELHDAAVRVVRDALRENSKRIISWTSDPGVMPSVWFEDSAGKPNWVIVRACRAPEKNLPAPDAEQAKKIKAQMGGAAGYYACVSFSGKGEDGVVYRGEENKHEYSGLSPLGE